MNIAMNPTMYGYILTICARKSRKIQPIQFIYLLSEVWVIDLLITNDQTPIEKEACDEKENDPAG